ncbi:MAG: hypothetical protein VXY11_00840 [Candidatus Thermoplasmatota archaeon]|nr:hypothetical protein [Candidatus Thermoplasmatota archaeon]MEC8789299.1 hypothetical protein [Candidatus Thermoplasmatota archaeon]
MRARILLITLALLLSPMPSTQAGSPQTLEDVGAVFGGMYLDANESGNASSTLSDLPAIVEDYTATWCTNCISVEKALKEIEAENSMQTYHFHRFIGESEDPLGSQEGDDRWIERYDQRIPPTAVFNGTIRQIGSVPDGDSLQDDYNQNLENSLNLGIGSSSLGWAVSNGSNPVVTWNLVVDMANFPDGSQIESSLWIVEKLAYFPDGGNEEEYYNNSVRGIIGLGNATTGTMEVTIPTAYDGNDLQVHLIHEVILPQAEESEEEPQVSEEDDEDSLPSIGLVAVIGITMFAAAIVQRRQQ